MKKLLFGLMLVAAVVAAGPAMAYNYAEHVTLAPENRGDFLIYPVYVALDGGWYTKLAVVNTSYTYSTVAKVVIRSFKYSKELLDFFIYLSPTDVWTGQIIFGPNGVRLFSDDDSIRIGTHEFASPASPVEQDITQTVCSDDAKEIGYVEVFEAWSSNIGAKPRPKWDANAPLTSVQGAFEAATEYVTRNILTGHYEIENDAAGFLGAMNATVLQDYNVNARLGIAAGEETFIGQNANNSICEVEAVLSKMNLGFYFYDSDTKVSLPVMTFPTKLVSNARCECGDSDEDTLAPVESPFFDQNSSDNPDNETCYRIRTDFKVNDLKETVSSSPLFSPAPSGAVEDMEEEVHLITKTYAFNEGWINLPMSGFETTCKTLAQPQVGSYTLTFAGAPVILTNFIFSFTDGGIGLGIMGGDWDFPTVYYTYPVDTTTTTVPLNDYQLVDFLPPSLDGYPSPYLAP